MATYISATDLHSILPLVLLSKMIVVNCSDGQREGHMYGTRVGPALELFGATQHPSLWIPLTDKEQKDLKKYNRSLAPGMLILLLLSYLSVMLQKIMLHMLSVFPNRSIDAIYEDSKTLWFS